MSKDFPAWRYDPVTREGRVFDTADDVPEGWVDRLGAEGEVVTVKVKGGAAKAPEPKDDGTMTRAEIMAALKGGGVDFKVTAKTDELHDLLKGKVMEVLTQRNIEFDADADARTLLAKLG